MEVAERGQSFIAGLHRLRADRGAMAELRRGLSPSTAYRSWSHIHHWCDLANDSQRIVTQTVAAAYAFHPDARQRGNVGQTCRELAMESRGKEGLKTFEATFRRLLSASSRLDVCRLMRRVILAAAAREVSLNHLELYKDLTYWGERVKIRWAKAYWGGTSEEKE